MVAPVPVRFALTFLFSSVQFLSASVLARRLCVYIKRAHLDSVPGRGAFLQEMISEQTSGPESYVVDRGLVPVGERKRQQAAAGLAEHF
jgi:hypothetical protein